MMPAGRGGWCALFLRAPSPGQVFRFLQRRPGQAAGVPAPEEATILLLSDPAGPEGWRVLAAGRGALGWMEAACPAFAQAFPPAVTLLFAADGWGFRVWAAGGESERGGGARRRGPLARLLGETAEREAAAWALDRRLPADRIPALAGRRPPPVCDYATVAGLDERGLLVEDGPRLYRFPLAGAAADGG